MGRVRAGCDLQPLPLQRGRLPPGCVRPSQFVSTCTCSEASNDRTPRRIGRHRQRLLGHWYRAKWLQTRVSSNHQRRYLGSTAFEPGSWTAHPDPESWSFSAAICAADEHVETRFRSLKDSAMTSAPTFKDSGISAFLPSIASPAGYHSNAAG